MISLKNLQTLAKQQKISITGKTGNYKLLKAKKLIASFRTLTEVKQYLDSQIKDKDNDRATEVPRITTDEPKQLSTIGSITDGSTESNNSNVEQTAKRHESDTTSNDGYCQSITTNRDDISTNCLPNWQIIEVKSSDCATLHTFTLPTTITTTSKNHEQQKQQTGSKHQRIERNTISEGCTRVDGNLQASDQEKLTLAQQICTDEYVELVLDEIRGLLENLLDGTDFDDSKAYAIAGDFLIPARLNRSSTNHILKFYRHEAMDNYRLVAYSAFFQQNEEYYNTLFHDRVTGFYFDEDGCYQNLGSYSAKIDINDVGVTPVTDENWLIIGAEF